uniref:Glucose-methanol-choline oxidoreductase N-terminal domain-containing protein n=2 Tax=Davidia involucrata TaxID=16924 RepID=A0A5B6ZF07_DAVIN
MGSGLWSSIGTALVGILFFHGYCFAEKAPYYSFVRDATMAPPAVYYDYIIIGGGTAGCALAATLSQGSVNVLLLERGGSPYGNPNISNIVGFASTLQDTSPSSASQPFVSTDGVFNHRGRVLGGTTALNIGFYTRASTAYVNQVGWDHKLVNESYEWVEKKMVFKPSVLQFQSAVRDGLLEVGVLPDNGFTYDHLYGTKVSGTIFDQKGDRHTAADLLEYADPRRITVYLNATVHQILFKKNGNQKPRAYGVLFRDGKGNKHIAKLNNGSMDEIILSAGALGSPQLLMLSGIGPKEHLLAHGIKVVLNQPMVGQGMADNSMNALVIPSPRPVGVSLVQVVGIPWFDSYIEANSFPNFSFSWLGDPTIQPVYPQAGLIVEKITGPFSSGELKLRTSDPNDNPDVTFNYFKDWRDLQRCVQGMKTIIKVVESKSFSEFRFANQSVQDLINMMIDTPVNTRPRHANASSSLEQFCIDTVMTIWHYHGGCQVGRVVDRDYRVLGVDALRVVDGSTFYDSPGTNPQATVLMLGRYVGERILDERFPNTRK